MTQKTRFGVTVGAVGAITYFAALFGGYLPVLVLAGYVLLFEENTWLRRSVVKAVVLMAFFSVLLAIIGLIPDAIALISSIANMFQETFMLPKVNQVIAIINKIIDLIQSVLFLGLGFKALNQGTIVIPLFDSMVSKYMQ